MTKTSEASRTHTRWLSSSCLHIAGRWLPRVAFITVLAIYVLSQVRGFSPAYVETDPDAYLFLAKRMAMGQPLIVNTNDPFLYQHHMWVETAPGQVTSKYTPGFPAFLAVAYRLAGDRGMFMVSPIMGGLALIGAWLLFLLWLKPFSAVMALLTLALLPQYSFYSAYMLTHATSLCLTTWGMYFLWRWKDQPQLKWGLATGAAFGAALTVRPSDILLLLPMLAAGGATLWQGRRSGWRPWLRFAEMLAAWGLFAGLLALYNYMLFGGMTLTGYALSDEQNGFSLQYFIQHFSMIVNGMNHNFLPVFLPLGLAGMILWGPMLDRTLRLLWFIPIFITYTSYYWVNGNWSCLRFFITTLPVCIGSAYAILDLFVASRTVRVVTLLVLMGLFINLNLVGLQDVMSGRPITNNPRELARAAGKLATNVPADAVIFSQTPMCYSLGQRAAYTVYELRAFSRWQSLERFKEVHPERETEPRRQPVRTQRLREFYEKTTDQDLLASERSIINSSIKSGRATFFLLSGRQYEAEKQKLGPEFTWKAVEEWDVDWKGPEQLQHDHWGIYLIRPNS